MIKKLRININQNKNPPLDGEDFFINIFVSGGGVVPRIPFGPVEV
jgi:hypothetical protein